MMVSFLLVLGFAASAFACESCYGPQDDIVRTREVYPIRPNQNLVKRMQPDAQAAAYGPTHGELAWGQLNVIVRDSNTPRVLDDS